jgi:transcriptional regulator with XRE-family HTH domain
MQFEIFGLSKQTLDLFVNVNNFFIMGFGKQIKRLRLKSKVSAQMLADRLGVKAEKFRKWEQFDREPAALDALKIEEAFGLTMAEIMKLIDLPRGIIMPSSMPGAVVYNIGEHALMNRVKEKAFARDAALQVVLDELKQLKAYIMKRDVRHVSVEIDKAIEHAAQLMLDQL